MINLFRQLKNIGFFALIGMILASCGGDEPAPPLASVVANFSYTVDNEGFAPATVTFTNESLAATTYQWDFGVEDGTSSEENPTFLYEDFGTYTVSLTAIAEDGREDTKTEQIIIKDPLGGRLPTLYYTDRATGMIHMVVLDEEAETPVVQSFGADHFKPYGISADLENETLFVVGHEDGIIFKYDALVNGDKEVLFNIADEADAPFVDYPAGITVIGSKIFWGAIGGIYSSNLDGSNPSQLVEVLGGESLPLGLSYDAENDWIYFCNDGLDFGGGVYRVHLDGTGLELVVADVDAGAISYLNGKLYYFDYIEDRGVIYDIATETAQALAPYTVNFPWGIVADPITEKVYWTDRGTEDDGSDGVIWCANLDGSEPMMLLEAADAPNGILRPYALGLGLY
ncbi:PKD domain-containing protein [Persicobacter diffluens]